MIEARLKSQWTLYACLLACLLQPSFAIDLHQGDFQKRDGPLDEIISTYKLPGIAGLAIHSNGTLETAVAGVRKYGNDTAMTTRDKFHLGSNTKAMTATLLAIIIEKGNGSLTWNSTLSEALPQVQNISREFSNVTLAMVGAHRSGIASDVPARSQSLFLELFQPGIDPVEGRQRVVDLFLQAPPDVTPNTSFNYSNVNFLILGHIIDNQGTPWAERIKSDLWEPLGMNECGFGPAPQMSNETIDNPWPHMTVGGNPAPLSPYSQIPPADNPATYGPAGTVHCSMSSYSKFLSFHLSGLNGQNTTLLSSSSFRVLQDPYPFLGGEEPLNILTSGGWAYGPASYKVYGGAYLIHTGSNNLNYAITIVAPMLNVSVAAFTNVGGTGALTALSEVVNGWFNGTVTFDTDVVGGNETEDAGGNVNGTDTTPSGSVHGYTLYTNLLLFPAVIVAWLVL